MIRMQKQKSTFSIVLLLVIILFTSPLNFAATYPDHTSQFYFNDFAGILSNDTEEQIMSVAVPLAEKTGAQIVVVTVESLEGESIESYATALFREWGIGDATQNNGVLLLISVEDRQSRIEVGYGLEGALNDAKTGRIQDDYLVSNFGEGRFDEGVLGTYFALLSEVYAEYGLSADDLPEYTQYYAPVDTRSNASDGISLGEVLMGIIVVILVILDLIFNRGRLTRFVIYTAARSSSKGSRGGGGFGGGGGRSGGGGSSRSW